MTHTEVIELADWIEDRWPHTPWSDREIEAFANDAGDIPFAVAYDAVQRLNAQGRQYPPKVSEVFGLAKQLNRHTPTDKPRALPGGTGWRFTIAEWLTAHGYQTREEAIEGWATGEQNCTGKTSCPRCAVAANSAPTSNEGYRPPAAGCDHPYWAIWEEHDDGERTGRCPRCGYERRFVRGALQAEAEYV